jgi:hypothetical protein
LSDDESSVEYITSRCSLRQDNIDFCVVHDSPSDRRHDGDFNNILSSCLVPAGRVCQRSVPSKRKGIIPSAHDGITRSQFKNTVSIYLRIFWCRWGDPKTRGRNIADEVVVIRVSDASRKMKCECRQCMRRRPFIEGLRLVVKPGEVAFQAKESYNRFQMNTFNISLRRASVVQMDIILNIQVRPPMADFGRACEFQDLQHWLFVEVVDDDGLLVFLDEVLVC